MTTDEKDLAVAAAQGFTQALLKPGFDVWDNLVLPHLHGKRDEIYMRQEANLRVLKAKCEKMAETTGIEPKQPELKVYMAILENAAREERPDLQDRWAVLFVNASNASITEQITVTYTEILRQLTSADIRFLDALFNQVCDTHSQQYGSHITANSIQGVELPIDSVHSIYDQLADDATVKTAYLAHGDYERYPDTPHHLSVVTVMVRNCMRLGLMDRVMKPRKDPGRYGSERIPQDTYFFLTGLGYEFVRACRPPKPEPTELKS